MCSPLSYTLCLSVYVFPSLRLPHGVCLCLPVPVSVCLCVSLCLSLCVGALCWWQMDRDAVAAARRAAAEKTLQREAQAEAARADAIKAKQAKAAALGDPSVRLLPLCVQLPSCLGLPHLSVLVAWRADCCASSAAAEGRACPCHR